MIREIMNKPVVTVGPYHTLRQAVETLGQHHLTGVPVVTDNGECIGVISQTALLDVLFDPTLLDVPVCERMSPDVPAVGTDESLTRAAHLLILHGVDWLPVTEGHAVVGTVSCGDLLQHAMQQAEPLTEPLVELMPPLGRMT